MQYPAVMEVDIFFFDWLLILRIDLLLLVDPPRHPCVLDKVGELSQKASTWNLNGLVSFVFV